MVLFLPGFYLLVPGASGLIDVTASVSPGFSTGSLATTVTVVAIALGVLFATAAVDGAIGLSTTWRRRRGHAPPALTLTSATSALGNGFARS